VKIEWTSAESQKHGETLELSFVVSYYSGTLNQYQKP